MRRLLIIAVLLFGCHHETPTEPSFPYPMGANGDSTVSGVVLSADGQPVPGVLVVARIDGGTFDHRMHTDRRGSFRIGDLIPHGNYTLTVFLATRPDPVKWVRVTLERFKDTAVAISLPPIPLPATGCTYVSGHVTPYREPTPIEGVQISFLGSTTKTNPQGWYSLEVGCPPSVDPTGYYAMHVEHPDYIPFDPQILIQPQSFVYDIQLLRKNAS